MRSWLALFAAVLMPVTALAQGEEPPKIIIVPVANYDAGTPELAPAPPPVIIEQPVAPQPQPPPQPPAEPPTRQFQANPTDPVATPVPTTAAPPEATGTGPGAMLDGHPREGPFLAGSGSGAFVAHHTLMGGLGVLATQMVPRLLTDPSNAFTPNARIAYLTGALVGAAVGFGASAWYQFYNWIGIESASFGIINSAVGAMFMVGFSNLFSSDPTPISWLGLLGGEAAAWLTVALGGGEFPVNKGLLITSGAAWAAIYTSLILGIVATSGGGSNLKAGIDAILLTPALGAGLMALAALKFNPSIGQIVRADIFGAAVGGGVLLLSAIILGVRFDLPTPYILGAVGAAGAMTVVSLLYAEAAEAAPPAAKSAWWYQSKEKDRPYSTVWW